MQRSNQFSVKIKINENTMAEKLINVNEGCHGVLKVGLETHFCESRFRGYRSRSQAYCLETWIFQRYGL